ncbi:hypothetical protein MOD25_05640 [Bacillus haynesii]|uniref:hypothetical protein n=1 Tax=Bacillus haynesii TaxID=1925021 RepID=UPI002280CC2C|nr:hypothetical protein [Bacillus haynesii]MCY8549384.1 hypothetical protein [Bacillus haynesii]
MSKVNLVVDGHVFNETQSIYLMRSIAKAAKLNNLDDVQEYLKGFKVEERSTGYAELDEFVLRNPDRYGLNFAIMKNL